LGDELLGGELDAVVLHELRVEQALELLVRDLRQQPLDVLILEDAGEALQPRFLLLHDLDRAALVVRAALLGGAPLLELLRDLRDLEDLAGPDAAVEQEPLEALLEQPAQRRRE